MRSSISFFKLQPATIAAARGASFSSGFKWLFLGTPIEGVARQGVEGLQLILIVALPRRIFTQWSPSISIARFEAFSLAQSRDPAPGGKPGRLRLWRTCDV